mmetsp:Transcript_4935/g.7612  ORF Transcript_4935/g.7612 Transcript_4935/m.7612 type:complete len:192 (-) Transcript_4935:702-1277(-)
MTEIATDYTFILHYSTIYRCHGCNKVNFFLTHDANRKVLRERNLVSATELTVEDFCHSDDQGQELAAIAYKDKFESSLRRELDPNLASGLRDMTEEEEFTLEPSSSPSRTPSNTPSVIPSNRPSLTPSVGPSLYPSARPTTIGQLSIAFHLYLLHLIQQIWKLQGQVLHQVIRQLKNAMIMAPIGKSMLNL